MLSIMIHEAIDNELNVDFILFKMKNQQYRFKTQDENKINTNMKWKCYTFKNRGT